MSRVVKYSLQQLFLWLTGFAVFLGLILWLYQGLTHVEYGENQSSVSWLPKSAANVSYYKSYSFTAYEFEISEAEFVKWRRGDVSPITSGVTLPRYCFIKMKTPDFGPSPTEQQLQIQMEAMLARTVSVSNGLSFSHRRSNGGGVIVAYDRTAGKAYYWSAPR